MARVQWPSSTPIVTPDGRMTPEFWRFLSGETRLNSTADEAAEDAALSIETLDDRVDAIEERGDAFILAGYAAPTSVRVTASYGAGPAAIATASYGKATILTAANYGAACASTITARYT